MSWASGACIQTPRRLGRRYPLGRGSGYFVSALLGSREGFDFGLVFQGLAWLCFLTHLAGLRGFNFRVKVLQFEAAGV